MGVLGGWGGGCQGRRAWGCCVIRESCPAPASRLQPPTESPVTLMAYETKYHSLLSGQNRQAA